MVGFNMSGILETPVLWFCRNNGYAISTPVVDQYCGDGIVSRASGYGMYSCRFDGNDIFATYIATKQSRELAINECRPVCLEAMTYRGGHHSTSDDSKTYREVNEEKLWNNQYNPVTRMRKYLELVGLWDEQQQNKLVEKLDIKIEQAHTKSQACDKPNWQHMFEDVYKHKTERLMELYIFFILFFCCFEYKIVVLFCVYIGKKMK